MDNEILKLFSDFISIQSVSADSKRHNEILKAVEFLKKELKSLGFETDILQKNNCPPLIIAKKYISSKAKTVGVYAHYDVQPEDPIEQWESPPYKLTLKNGKFFGRGVSDCKGHIIQTLVAINQLIDTKKLNNNIVLIFEGEEEIGSAHFENLIKKVEKEIEKVDVFYLLDFGVNDKNCGKILFGLRGLIGFELTVKTAEADLHSGMFGNQAKNPVQIIAELLTKIKDNRTGKILIPGFYEKIKKPTKKEQYFLEKTKKNDSDLLTRIFPSFDVNGILSGYTGEGVKTIIPAVATVKFSFRLIEEQTPEGVEKLVMDFVKNSLPEGIKYSFKTLARLTPFHIGIDNLYIKKSAAILKKTFGDAVFTRSGGSVGAAATLGKIFKKPIVMTGFVLDGGNIHSPNENFDEEMFFKGIEALKKMLSV